MPNYGLVVTPEYKPMSYEQYVQPFKDYAQVYNTMADSYDALEMEANQWEKLANSAVDAPQYAQYKKYADDLHAAAADLATNGLTNKTRSALSQLRKRYAGEIKPIEDAYTYRQKLAEEWRKQNPTGDILLSEDPSQVSLSTIMQNPNWQPKAISQSFWEKEAYEQGKAASTREDAYIQDFDTLQSAIAEQYGLYRTGYTKDEVDNILQGRIPPELKRIMDSLYDSVDVNGFSDEQISLLQQRMLNGFISGLSEEKRPVADQSYASPYDWASLRARATGKGGGGRSDDYIILRKDPETGKPIEWVKGNGKSYIFEEDENGRKVIKIDKDGNPMYFDPDKDKIHVDRNVEEETEITKNQREAEKVVRNKPATQEEVVKMPIAIHNIKNNTSTPYATDKALIEATKNKGYNSATVGSNSYEAVPKDIRDAVDKEFDDNNIPENKRKEYILYYKNNTWYLIKSGVEKRQVENQSTETSESTHVEDVTNVVFP